MRYKSHFISAASIALLPLMFSGCMAGRFYDEAYEPTQRLELGTVQKEIHEGMAQDQVAFNLGSPNIVTVDKDRKETWIYDKIATEVRQSGSAGLILFCQTGADYISRRDVSQKTLTVIIKFNADRCVESVSYHASKF